MTRFRIKYLRYSLILLCGCASDYKTLHPTAPRQDCISKFAPKGIQTSLFDAGIDVVGKHISGLLLIKKMPDSSSRVVFTNEAGFKFLDFEFGRSGEFKVHHVIEQLNKKVVIRLLEKDFGLLLALPFKGMPLWKSWEKGAEIYHGVTKNKETHYFITDKDCSSLLRVESASGQKKMVSLLFYGPDQELPDSVKLQHHTFDMQIGLRKINRD
jgi:hypothetical protein